MEIFSDLISTIEALPGQSFIFATAKAFAIGTAFFSCIFALENFYRVNTGFYRTKNFRHDLIYWFYYKGGFHNLLFMSLLMTYAGSQLERFNLHLITDIPFALQALIYLIWADLFGYWIHRWQHSNRFLWAFHTTHHSQEDLNLFSTARFHPLEHFLQNLLVLIPMAILGANPNTWIVYYVVMECQLMLQHSRVPWTYGPLYYVITSPRFHNYHHSTDPKHVDKNFAGFFSIIDVIFGTAVKDDKPASNFGLKDVKPNSFWDTITEPFYIVMRELRPPLGKLRNNNSQEAR